MSDGRLPPRDGPTPRSRTSPRWISCLTSFPTVGAESPVAFISSAQAKGLGWSMTKACTRSRFARRRWPVWPPRISALECVAGWRAEGIARAGSLHGEVDGPVGSRVRTAVHHDDAQVVAARIEAFEAHAVGLRQRHAVLLLERQQLRLRGRQQL